jgi:hypothetical protein
MGLTTPAPVSTISRFDSMPFSANGPDNGLR